MSTTAMPISNPSPVQVKGKMGVPPPRRQQGECAGHLMARSHNIVSLVTEMKAMTPTGALLSYWVGCSQCGRTLEEVRKELLALQARQASRRKK